MTNAGALAALAGVAAFAQSNFTGFNPGNLAVSRSVYKADATVIAVGQKLPPKCAAACGTGAATDTGAFPAAGSTNNVWNNDKADGSFGVTSPIFLDQITDGTKINTLTVPTGCWSPASARSPNWR